MLDKNFNSSIEAKIAATIKPMSELCKDLEVNVEWVMNELKTEKSGYMALKLNTQSTIKEELIKLGKQ